MIRSFFLLLSLCLFLSIPSCDYIEDPDGNNQPPPVPCSDTPSFTPRIDPVRKVLLEDYTGHRCGNCPNAGTILKDLISANPDQVVGLAIHAENAGYFTAPKNDGDKFRHDFRNEVSNTLDAEFQIAATGLPKGMVNRKAFNGTKALPPSTWNQAVNTELALDIQADVQLAPEWNETDRSLCVFAFVESRSSALPSNLKLAVYLAEHKFVNWQADYSVPGEEIENYEHNHILRTAIGPIWGRQVLANTSANGSNEIQVFSANLSGQTWDMNNCSLVAVLYDDQSMEVIQAEEVQVIP